MDQLCADQGIAHRLIPPRQPETNGLVERFNGRISEVLASVHLRNREELEATLERYRHLYNGQIPQKNLGARTPVEVLKAYYESNPDRFWRKPPNPPSPDTYELLLAIHDIEHRTTKVRSPRTNGFVERMNRTLLDECFRVSGRQTWYVDPEEIQRDLDTFLRYCNLERSHQGYRLQGKTPAQALKEALGREDLPPLIPEEDTETDETAA